MPLLKCSSSASDSDLPVIPLIRKKVVVVGDAECGKTCLLHTFAKNASPSMYVSTVYEHYTVDKDGVRLSLWDTAGKDDICSNVRPMYYPETDLVILCFDISRRDSLTNVKSRWLPEIKHFCPRVPIILVGNKTDKRIINAKKKDGKVDGNVVFKVDGGVDVKEIGMVDAKVDGGVDAKVDGGMDVNYDSARNVKQNYAFDVKETGMVDVNDNGVVDVNDDGVVDIKDNSVLDVNGDSVEDVKGDSEMDVKLLGDLDAKVNVKVDVDLKITDDVEIKMTEDKQIKGTKDRDSSENYLDRGSHTTPVDELVDQIKVQKEYSSEGKESENDIRFSQDIYKPTNQDVINAFFKEGQIFRENIPPEMLTPERQRRVSSILTRGLSMSKDGWGEDQIEENIKETENIYNLRKVSSIVKNGLLMSKGGWSQEQYQNNETPLKENEETIQEDENEYNVRHVSSIVKKGLLMSKEGWSQQQAENEQVGKRTSLCSTDEIVNAVIDMALNKFEEQYDIMETSTKKDDFKSLNGKEMSCNHELQSVPLVRQVLKQQNSPINLAKKAETEDDHESPNEKEMSYNYQLKSAKLVSQVMKQQNSPINQAKKEDAKDDPESLNWKEMSCNLELQSDTLVSHVLKDQNSPINEMQKEETMTLSNKNVEDKKVDNIQEDANTIEDCNITKNIADKNNSETLQDVNLKSKDVVQNNNDNTSGHNTHDIFSSENTKDLEEEGNSERENSKINIQNENIVAPSDISINSDPKRVTGINKVGTNEKFRSEDSVCKKHKQTVTAKSPNIFDKFRDSLNKDNSLVEIEEGKNMAKQIGAIAYLECSAKKISGITEVFDIAIKIEKMKNKRMIKIKNPCKCVML